MFAERQGSDTCGLKDTNWASENIGLSHKYACRPLTQRLATNKTPDILCFGA